MKLALLLSLAVSSSAFLLSSPLGPHPTVRCLDNLSKGDPPKFDHQFNLAGNRRILRTKLSSQGWLCRRKGLHLARTLCAYQQLHWVEWKGSAPLPVASVRCLPLPASTRHTFASCLFPDESVLHPPGRDHPRNSSRGYFLFVYVQRLSLSLMCTRMSVWCFRSVLFTVYRPILDSSSGAWVASAERIPRETHRACSRRG